MSALHTKAFEAERVNAARRINLLRFGASSLFFLVHVVMGLGLGHAQWRAALIPFCVVVVMTALVYVLSARSDRFARVSALGVPFLDMPAVLVIQYFAARSSEHPEIVSHYTIGVMVLLLVLASMTLERWLIWAAVGIAAVGTISLQWVTEFNIGGAAAALVLYATVGGGCYFIVGRVLSLTESIASEQTRRAHLARFLSPQVLEAVERIGAGSLTSESCVITVLFADLRDFTALSESLPPGELVTLLNEVHTRMEQVIFVEGGTLDKFTGDGVMAYFGAPLAQADHAERAVRCALGMQAALARLNEERAMTGGKPLRMGIGLNTGPAIVGEIGSSRRREFTAIGDTVNVAARIEGLTKLHEAQILVSEETRARITTAVTFHEMPPTAVKGKARPVRTFAASA